MDSINEKTLSDILKPLEIANGDARQIVIENGVFIEEVFSIVLANILDIDIKTSKTLGSGSNSLSFMNKVHLIQDVRKVNKELFKKITVFAEIRNKFAHVRSCKTFSDYFNNTSKGPENKKEIIKWYGIISMQEDLEFTYTMNFFSLVSDIYQEMFKIFLHCYLGKIKKQDNESISKRIIEKLRTELAISPITPEIWDRTISDTLSEIRKENPLPDIAFPTQ